MVAYINSYQLNLPIQDTRLAWDQACKKFYHSSGRSTNASLPWLDFMNLTQARVVWEEGMLTEKCTILSACGQSSKAFS